jgi:two-component system NtrC family sensor kinase
MLITHRSFFSKFWPKFFFHKPNPHLYSFYTFLNYPRIWFILICILTITSLLPLSLATMVHYKLIEQSVNSELTLRTERLTSNARQSIVFFFEERLDALIFTINEMTYEQLDTNSELKNVLKNLKLGFGGFTDLSVIDSTGQQLAYAGPYNLEGKNYKNQPWFSQSLKNEHFVSDVFTGYRDAPHIIIAVRSNKPDGSVFILRATLDTERLRQMLLSYRPNIHTDIFLLNHQGIVQTPSINFGDFSTKIPVAVPEFSSQINVQLSALGRNKEKTVMGGHSYISTDQMATPFILMVYKEKEGVMREWLNLGKTFNWIIGTSSIIIIIIISLISNFMVNALYLADKTKAKTMLQMEQNHQLASIGQLAAGVAHEINNPLALINETAGYIKDMHTFSDDTMEKDELLEHIDSVLEATERCGAITSQLLGFVRQFDIKIRKINVGEIIKTALNFHKKEAEYRNITVSTSLPDLPVFIQTDRGKLQQVLVNLITNAFQALDEGGRLDIIVQVPTSNNVQIIIKDTGCGISKENIKQIQEPFFTTKAENSGTGLGLSITYGIVNKLKGEIYVESTEGVGTAFTVSLPVSLQEKGDFS